MARLALCVRDGLNRWMSQSSASEDVREFKFDFQRRYAPMLAAMGITPATSWVRVGPDEIKIRFGPWTCTSALSNITCVVISGPYRAHRAIGSRGSFADGGATFGSTTAGGVCMEFRRPVTALDLTKHLKHKGLTVTVKNRDEFATYLRQAAGLPPESAGSS
jgi:hypothetical protein